MWNVHSSYAHGFVFVLVVILTAVTSAVFSQEKMAEIDRQAIQAILSADTAEGRGLAMDAHPELVSRDGVFAVFKQGEDAVNTGQFPLALRACDAADEIAERAGLDPFTLGISGMMRGGLLGKMNRHEDAIKTLVAARPLVKQGKNLAIEGMLVLDLAEQYLELGEVDKAKATYEESLRLARGFGKAPSLEAEVLGKLGSLERKLGHPQAAMEILEGALAIAQKTGRAPLEASLLLNIGFLLDDMGKTPRALAHHQQALEIYKKSQDRAGTISALNACAVDTKNLGRFRGATGLYGEALQRAEAIHDDSMVAAIKDNLGTVLRSMGRWDQGVKLHEEALAIYLRLKQPSGKQLVLNHLGIAHRVKGDAKTAVDYFDLALGIARSLKAPAEESTVLVNLGNAYSDMDRYEEAIRCYRKSLKIQERLGNPRAIAAALMNLANLYKELRRYKSQKLFLAQARDKAREARDPLTEAAALQALASIEGQEGDKSVAVTMAEEALGLLPQDCSERAYGLLELAMRRWDLGELDLAIRHAEAAADAAKKTSQPGVQALALMLAGMARLPQERADSGGIDPQTAFERLSEAAVVAEFLDDWQLTWLCYYFRGKAHAALGDDRRKFEDYLAAAKAIDRQRGLGWSPTERELFAERPVRLYRLIALDYLKQGKTAEAFHYAELGKAQIMLESMSARPLTLSAKRGSPELDLRQKAALKRLGEIDTMLRRERSHLEEERDEELISELRGKREEAEDELRQIKGELQRQDPEYADLNYPRPAKLDAACAALGPHTVLIEYVVESDGAAAFILSREGDSVCPLSMGGKELSQRLKALHQSLGRKRPSAGSPTSETDFSRQAHELYLALIHPIRHLFPPGTDRLVIVPDGPLHLAPFAALVVQPKSEDHGQTRYLCEEYCLSYVPSVTVLLELDARKPSGSPVVRDRIVAVCDPAYAAPSAEPAAHLEGEIVKRSSSSWNRLAASAHEGAEIRSVWGDRATLLSRMEATEERVKAVADHAVCLHFATHAYLDSTSPLYSAIVLAPGQDHGYGDGYLQAYEVCEMDLEGALVVLSACETARGAEREGEGLMGLSRAFFLARASAVVATLWKVDDEATSVLGAELHRRLKEGQSVSEALRQAQLAMLHGYDRRAGLLRGPGPARPRESAKPQEEATIERTRAQQLPPFYWAAFGVYGDPSASLAAGKRLEKPD